MASLSIGRSRSCSIVIDSPTVSRHHADLIEVGGDRYRFEDRGSTAGSFRFEGGGWRPITIAEIGRNERVRMGDFECTLDELLGQVRQSESRPVDNKPVRTVIERDPATGQIVIRRL